MIGRDYGLTVSVLCVLISGCVGSAPGADNIDLDGVVVDGQSGSTDANSTGESGVPRDRGGLHSGVVVLEGCYGVEAMHEDTSETLPWGPPPGWEEPLVWLADYQVAAIQCAWVDNGGIEVLTNVSLLYDAHNNLDVPAGAPIEGGYNSLAMGLSFYSSAPQLLDWWPTPVQASGHLDLELLDGGRTGFVAAVGEASYSIEYPQLNSTGASSQELVKIWVASVDPLVYLHITESWRGDQIAASGTISADAPFEAAKLRDSPLGVTQRIAAGPHVGTSLVIRIVEAR